jgi:hypothetical protein
MWDVGCGMWDVGCGMWDVGCGMWDGVIITHEIGFAESMGLQKEYKDIIICLCLGG